MLIGAELNKCCVLILTVTHGDYDELVLALTQHSRQRLKSYRVQNSKILVTVWRKKIKNYSDLTFRK